MISKVQHRITGPHVGCKGIEHKVNREGGERIKNLVRQNFGVASSVFSFLWRMVQE